MVFWLPLRQSRYLYWLRYLQLGCAALALWHVHWPLTVQAVALLMIVMYARHQRPLPEALLFDSHGLQLCYAKQRSPARLGSQCYCSEFLVVLSIEQELEKPEEEVRGRAVAKRWLVLLPDSSSPDALRRLRVYLRWHAKMPE